MKHLVPLALAAAATAAQAAPFATTYTGVIANSTFPEIINGEKYRVTVVFDNGGSSPNNQTWSNTTLRCVLWNMNDGPATAYYQQTTFASVGPNFGPFKTDAAGALVQLPLYFFHNAFNSADSFTTNIDLSGRSAHWSVGAGNPVFTYMGAAPRRDFYDTYNGNRMDRAVWSHPVPVSNLCDAPLPTPPGAPENLAAMPVSSTSVQVSWAAPTPQPGGMTPARYNVTATTAGGNAAGTCVATHPTTSCNVAGLMSGQPYSFRATATAISGTSAATGPVTAAPQAGTPAVPTGLSATTGNARVTLTWSAPAAGSPEPTSYAVNAQPGGSTCMAMYPARTCIVTGLTNGTAYSFVVSATQAGAGGGTSGPSAAVSATPQATGPGSAQPVPTLGEWGLMLLAGLLGLVGLSARRKNS